MRRAFLHRAPSVMLFGIYGSVSEAISIDLANAILFTAFAVAWTGARAFDCREVQPVYLFGGAILWLIANRASPLNPRLDCLEPTTYAFAPLSGQGGIWYDTA